MVIDVVDFQLLDLNLQGCLQVELRNEFLIMGLDTNTKWVQISTLYIKILFWKWKNNRK